MLWLLIKKLGAQGMAELAEEAFELAAETADRMRQAGIPTNRHPEGCILVFPKPNESISRRWHLSTRGQFAHIVTLPGVTREMVSGFISELTES